MRWFLEGLRSAVTAIVNNPMRTALTTLGIIIGVASVIVMVAVSKGARHDIETRIASLGSNILQLRPGSARVRGRSVGADSNLPFAEKDVADIVAKVDGVVAVSGHFRRGGTVVAPHNNWLTNIDGVHPAFLGLREWPIDIGRNMTESEYTGAAKVAVVGATVARELFGEETAVGQRVRIANLPFEIIGVLSRKGAAPNGQDQDDVVLVPLATLRNRLIKPHKLVPRQVGYVSVKVESTDIIPRVRRDIEGILRQNRNIRSEGSDDFHIRDLTAHIAAKQETQRTLGWLLAIAATISLLVGGIGIMNIMLVSVTERTREIGLRLALGARRRDVRIQFLIEAVLLCLAGGIIGCALGIGTAVGIANEAEWPILIEPAIIVLALGAAALTGIFFGFFPAQRAASLNPIEALRTE